MFVPLFNCVVISSTPLKASFSKVAIVSVVRGARVKPAALRKPLKIIPVPALVKNSKPISVKPVAI